MFTSWRVARVSLVSPQPDRLVTSIDPVSIHKMFEQSVQIGKVAIVVENSAFLDQPHAANRYGLSFPAYLAGDIRVHYAGLCQACDQRGGCRCFHGVRKLADLAVDPCPSGAL